MPLTPEDVRNKQFTTVRLREGYDEDEVDAFLDEVEAELTRSTRRALTCGPSSPLHRPVRSRSLLPCLPPPRAKPPPCKPPPQLAMAPMRRPASCSWPSAPPTRPCQRRAASPIASSTRPAARQTRCCPRRGRARRRWTARAASASRRWSAPSSSSGWTSSARWRTCGVRARVPHPAQVLSESQPARPRRPRRRHRPPRHQLPAAGDRRRRAGRRPFPRRRALGPRFTPSCPNVLAVTRGARSDNSRAACDS